MLVWVAMIALGCSLGTGWALSGHFFHRPVFRCLLAPLFGLSLVTSLFCLGDLALPPEINVTLTLLLVVGTGFIGLKPSVLESAPYPPLGKGIGALLAGLAVTAWIFAVGSIQLYPDVDFLLWDLTQTTPGQRSPLMAAASLFGRDPWLGVQLLCGIAQVAVALGAFGLARVLSPESKLCWPLVGVYLLGATESGWLTFQKPEEALVHLWGLAAFIMLQQDGPNRRMLAVPLLAGLGLVCWPLAFGLVLTIPNWRKMLVVFVTVGVAQNLFFQGFSMGLLMASVAVLYQARKPGALSRAALSFCLLELAWGSQGLFGWVALSLEWGRSLERLWYESEVGQVKLTWKGLSVPCRGFLVSVSLLTLWLGVDGAETVVNDVVLIGGQEEEVRHARLVSPHTLESWLTWRGAAYGFQDLDREALVQASALEANFVYLSGPLPDPRVAALMAVAARQPFSGWTRESGGPALSRSCALYLLTGEPRTLEGVGVPWVIVRDESPIPAPQDGISADVLRVHLEGKKGEPRSLDAVLTATVEEDQPHEVPAASLISFRFQLHNPTEEELDLSVYRGVRFAPSYVHRPPLQPIDYPVAPLNLDVLPAGQSVTIVAYLRTSVHPLEYQVGIQLTRADGTYQTVPMTAPFSVRSWRVELPLDYPFKEETP